MTCRACQRFLEIQRHQAGPNDARVQPDDLLAAGGLRLRLSQERDERLGNLFAAEQVLLQLRRAELDNLVALYVALGGSGLETR